MKAPYRFRYKKNENKVFMNLIFVGWKLVKVLHLKIQTFTTLVCLTSNKHFKKENKKKTKKKCKNYLTLLNKKFVVLFSTVLLTFC